MTNTVPPNSILNNKKLFAIFIMAVFLFLTPSALMAQSCETLNFCSWGNGDEWQPGQAEGTGPYTITTPAQLATLATLVNNGTLNTDGKYFSIGADIDLAEFGLMSTYNNGNGWIPIGTRVNPFKGSFHGGGFKIRNLYIHDETLDYAGLFGYTQNKHISEFGLENVNITAGNYVGGFIGSPDGTFTGPTEWDGIYGGVEKIYVTGKVKGVSYVGGIAGAKGDFGYVNNSWSTASVEGVDHVGGIVGYKAPENCVALNSNIISNGINVGRISGDANYYWPTGNYYGFEGTLKNGSPSFWNNEIDGTSLTKEEIYSDPTINGLFAETKWNQETGGYEPTGWSTAAGFLPGFNGQPVAMPPHISGIVIAKLENLEGEGTQDEPYLISSVDDLLYLVQVVNVKNISTEGMYFTLTANLDLTAYGSDYRGGRGWEPIGTLSNPFMGNFWGNGKVISNLYINGVGNDYIDYAGLFGRVYKGEVARLGLENVNITATSYVGGVAGEIAGADGAVGGIFEVYVTGKITSWWQKVGGIVGASDSWGYVNNSYSTAVINGNEYVGGIVGSGNASNCAALNKVISSEEKWNEYGEQTGGQYVGRVAGKASYTTALNNNVAFAGMQRGGSSNEWNNKGLTNIDGEDISKDEILTDPTMGARFVESNEWGVVWATRDVGKLPGFEVAVDMPSHISGIFEGFAFLTGSGTDEDRYIIYTAEDLALMAQKVNEGEPTSGVYFKLDADIDLTGRNWIPIGTADHPFNGYFYGNAKNVIRNLYINNDELDYAGLFGYVEGELYIGGFGLVNVNINAGNNVGGVIGYVKGEDGKEYSGGTGDVYVTGTGTIKGNNHVGGIVGYLDENTFMGYAYATVAVEGNENVGGLAGFAENGNGLNNCVALNSSVKGNSNVGRVVGDANGYLADNYAFFAMKAKGDLPFFENREKTEKNGADLTREDIANGALGWFVRYDENSSNIAWRWTTIAGYLPGFGEEGVVEIPEHLAAVRYSLNEGNGTSESHYIIDSKEDLIHLADMVNNRGVSTAGTHFAFYHDIDLKGENWTPIGTATNPFSGNLWAGGHKIKNLTIENGSDNAGLFGYVKAEFNHINIDRLALVNVNINAGNNVGGVAGKMEGVHNDNEGNSGGFNVGIYDVYVTGKINGADYVGGVAGKMEGWNSVDRSYSTAAISGHDYVGGLVGSIDGQVTNSVALNSVVSGSSNVGRISGVPGYGVFTENYAFVGIKDKNNSSANWSNKGANNIDGADLTSAQIMANQTIGGLFTVAGAGQWDWRTAAGYLPGFGWSANLPNIPLHISHVSEPFIGFAGNGTKEGPYQIATETQLASLATQVNGGKTGYLMYFELANDIVLTQNFTPIGTAEHPFCGNFIGDGHKIYNLTINSTGNNAGLFGYIFAGQVGYVGLENVNIVSTGDNVGGVAGYVGGWHDDEFIEGIPSGVSNVYVTGSIKGNNNVGGVTGYNGSWSYMNHSYSIAFVNGNDYVGGLVGLADGGVENSAALSLVKGTDHVARLGTKIYADDTKEDEDGKTVPVNNWTKFVGNYELTIPVTVSINQTIGDRFTNGWATANGKLPGFGTPVDMPWYLLANYGFTGNGSQGNPYQISTAEELARVALLVNDLEGMPTVNKYFIVVENIDLAEYSNWMPIGTANSPFSGNFDGNGKVISNLTIDDANLDYAGLFGRIQGEEPITALVHNLGLENAKITARNYVGSIVGRIDGWGNVSYSYSRGEIEGNNIVGGIAGYANEIKNCIALNSIVKGNSNVGRIAGADAGWAPDVLDNNYALAGTTGYAWGDKNKRSINGEDLNAQGLGTSDKPYTITEAKHLANLVLLVNDFGVNTAGMYFSFINDINLSDYANWTPIGTQEKPFSGNFWGNGKTISNLTIDTDRDYAGLFGYVDGVAGTNISKFGLENVNIISTGDYVGSVAGYIAGADNDNYSGISDVYVYTTSTIKGKDYVGGIVGSLGEYSYLKRSYSTATIEGADYVGGIAGKTSAGINNNVALNPSVIGTGSNVGRVVGSGTGLADNFAFYAIRDSRLVPVWIQEQIWSNKEATGIDGADISAEILSDRTTLFNLFAQDQYDQDDTHQWTTAVTKLPGFDAALNMPKYLAVKNDVSDDIVFDCANATYSNKELICEGASFAEQDEDKWPIWHYSYEADIETNANSELGGEGKPLNAGAYKATATYEDEDNKGSITVGFVVEKRDVSNKIIFACANATYNGGEELLCENATNATIGEFAGKELSKDVTWDYSYVADIETNANSSLSVGAKPRPVTAGSYKVIAHYTDNNNFGNTEAVDFVVDKATQVAPVIADITPAITPTNVTFPAIPANEVSGADVELNKNGGDWQDELVFDGLTANTEYTFFVRYKEMPNYLASENSEIAFTTPKHNVDDKIILAAGSAVYTGSELSYNNATITVIEGEANPALLTYEYEAVGENASLGVNGKPVTVGTYTVIASYEDYYNKGTATETAIFTVTKASQVAPSIAGIPVIEATVITLPEVAANTVSGADVEFSRDDGASWQDSRTFSGLIANTEYVFVARYKETANYFASESSEEKTFRTVKHNISDNIEFAAGSATYTGTELAYNNATVSVIYGTVNTALLTYSYAPVSANASLVNGNPVTVGTYTVIASYEDEYNEGEATGLAIFTVNKRDVSTELAFVADIPVAYTGKELSYENINIGDFTGNTNPHRGYVYSANGENASLGTNNKPLTAGNYTVVANYEDDNNEGTATIDFEVGKATNIAGNIKFPSYGPTYTGSELEHIAVAIGVDGASLTCTSLYTVYSEKASLSAGKPLTAGDYIAHATCGDENNLGTRDEPFSVGKAEVSGKITFVCPNETYNGSVHSCEATIAGITGADNFAWDYDSDGEMINAGKYTILAHYEDDNNQGSATAEFTIDKASQVAPSGVSADPTEDPAPTIVKFAPIDPNTNGDGSEAEAEYSSDGDVWQDSPIFTGLTEDTEYTFWVRYKETANYLASEKAEIATVETPEKGTIASEDIIFADGSATYNGEEHLHQTASIKEETTVGENPVWSYSYPDGKPLNAGTYRVIVSYEDNDYKGAESKEVTFTVNKASQAAPVIGTPTITQTSIVFPAIAASAVSGADAEFSKDGGATWQGGNFSGLTANTEYTFLVRYKETANYNASSPATTSLKTLKTDVSTNIALVSNSATYNHAEHSVEAKLNGATAGANPAWTYVYATNGGNAKLGTNNKPLNAGEYKVTVSYEDDSNKGSAILTFTVGKATHDISHIVLNDHEVDHNGEEQCHEGHIGELPAGVEAFFEDDHHCQTEAKDHEVRLTFKNTDPNYHDFDESHDLTALLKIAAVETPIISGRVNPSIGSIGVQAMGNTIHLTNLPQNAKVEVYSLNGKQVYSSDVRAYGNTPQRSITVNAKGTYIIRVNSQTYRVSVK